MALAPNSISAIVPTRGDIDISGIVRHLKSYPEIGEVLTIVGATPYNRYVAAETAKYGVIFTQDDDCVTDIRPVIDAYTPGIIVNAMTREHAGQYQGRQTLIGFGAIFDKALVRSLDGWERDALFYRESDRIFATVNAHKTVFPDITILPYAHAPNRLWKQPDHLAAKAEMACRIFERTGIVA